ncbi:MAG TPA: hypothetical protein VHN80_00685 [Kineosporiaceae bacterium]|nr:hypothetical protein [Kineosporiaceae bacterium]
MSEQIRPDSPPPRGSADRLVVAGGVVILLGLAALGAAMLISVKRGSAPGAIAVLTLLIPIGLAISFSGLVVQFRDRRRL